MRLWKTKQYISKSQRHRNVSFSRTIKDVSRIRASRARPVGIFVKISTLRPGRGGPERAIIESKGLERSRGEKLMKKSARWGGRRQSRRFSAALIATYFPKLGLNASVLCGDSAQFAS